MNTARGNQTPEDETVRRLPSGLQPFAPSLWLLGLLLSLLTTGCVSLLRTAPRPGRTTISSPLVVLPAQTFGNYLVIEAKWDRFGPYRFLVDTGSSVTLISPELAKRYDVKDPPVPSAPQIRVKTSEGGTTLLPTTTIRRIELGDARFEYVPALIYDCNAVSAHLGVKIDGILGFPLFRETVLTLDYPRSRVVLNPTTAAGLLPGSTIPFNNSSKTPLIPIRLGDTTFIALVDSGSDAPLSLNPVGLKPTYAVTPHVGASVTISTLSGDHTKLVGRLSDTLTIGNYSLPRPLVEVTEELSSIGGELLKNFTVTFNQEQNQVTFYRDTTEPIASPPRRSTGLSFSKTPAYWRVAGVVPDSPGAFAKVQPGDLVTRINGELVAQWDLRRFELLVTAAPEITFTFLNGTKETNTVIRVFDLVP
jgi:hypothetical protein